MHPTFQIMAKNKKYLNVVIEGCCHGDLNKIYDSIKRRNKPVDLVIICGDFQAVRNEQDLNCLAVPPKYKRMGDFKEYYNGNKKAPYLTIFIGGNHEASNYLWELYYGGWIAPQMYYMGASSVINVKGLRIAGLSGIWNQAHFNLPHYERVPFDRSSERSIYHIRRFDVTKLALIRNGLDVMITHDWPQGIEHYGNLKQLLSIKKHFRRDVEKGELGSPPARDLLKLLRPANWFSAHLHVMFKAIVKHDRGDKITNGNLLDEAKINDDEISIALDMVEDVHQGKINNDEIELDLDIEEDSPKVNSKVTEKQLVTGNDTSGKQINSNEIELNLDDLNDTDEKRASSQKLDSKPLNNNGSNLDIDNSQNSNTEIESNTNKSGGLSTSTETKTETLENYKPPINEVQYWETTPKSSVTHFLALDKCLPRRNYLQFVQIPITSHSQTWGKKRRRSSSASSNSSSKSNKSSDTPRLAGSLTYDPEWLAITRATHKYFNTSLTPSSNSGSTPNSLLQRIPDILTNSDPVESKIERSNLLKLIDDELIWVKENIVDKSLLGIPMIIDKSAPSHSSEFQKKFNTREQPPEYRNKMTDYICDLLKIDNKVWKGDR